MFIDYLYSDVKDLDMSYFSTVEIMSFFTLNFVFYSKVDMDPFALMICVWRDQLYTPLPVIEDDNEILLKKIFWTTLEKSSLSHHSLNLYVLQTRSLK